MSLNPIGIVYPPFTPIKTKIKIDTIRSSRLQTISVR